MEYKTPIKEFEDNSFIINVGGVIFETTRTTLEKIPNTKLAVLDQLSSHYRPSKADYFFDRNPEIFAAVLNYYRMGELHLPQSFCSTSVIYELRYWGIPIETLEQCCWIRFNENLMKRKTLETLDSSPILFHAHEEVVVSSAFCSCWSKWRPRVWTFLEDPNSSTAAKVFAFFSALVVLVSLITLCMETHPHFRGNLTAEHYADIYQVPKKDILIDWGVLEDIAGIVEKQDEGAKEEEENTNTEKAFSNTTASFGNTDPSNENQPAIMGDRDPKRNDAPNRGAQPPHQRRKRNVKEEEKKIAVRQKILNRIRREAPAEDIDLVSQLRLQLGCKSGHGGPGGHPPHPHPPPPKKGPQKYTMDSLLTYTDPVFEIIEIACHAFFTLELLLRFIFCPSKKRFFLNPLNIIDLVSILPFYVEIIVNNINHREKYEQTGFDTILVFRVVRVFRIVRLGRHYRGLQVLAFTMWASLREIFLMLVFLSIGMVMFSSLAFYADMDTFRSIPDAFWWAIVTMTTVGYGDSVPSSHLGFLVGSMCAISGVLVIAFTVPVIVGNFLMFYQAVEYSRGRGRNDKPQTSAKQNHSPASQNIPGLQVKLPPPPIPPQENKTMAWT